jgi:hypothetical protein
MPSFSPARSGRRGGRHAKLDGSNTGKPLGLLSLGAKELEREVDALDLTEPCLALGACAANQQVGLDFVEPGTVFPGLWRAWDIASLHQMPKSAT